MDSISEKIFIDINGVKQGMIIKSEDAAQPVLLYLHGGMPEYFLTQKYPSGLEKYFTVIWWEQRGSGISYNAAMPRDCLTAEQLIADTLELTSYLRKRFHQEKIYLIAHSGGSFFGTHRISTWRNTTPTATHFPISPGERFWILRSTASHMISKP